MRNKFKAATVFRLIRPIRARWVILVLLSSFLLAPNSPAMEMKIITNIKAWNHPVKNVLQKYKVILYKVELHNKTYPIFYVKFPYDPWLGHNDKYFKPLYYETLKANGFWDYSFVDEFSNARINIKWNKKTRTLSEDMHRIK